MVAENSSGGAYAGEISCKDAWEKLIEDDKAQLLDVRTSAEWSYVGIPDLSDLGQQPLLIEWQDFPAGNKNPMFAEQVNSLGLDKDAPLLILCRSGVRSKHAAILLTAAGYTQAMNITHGFEGDKDDLKRRSTKNGWRFDALPWVQG